MSLEGNKEVIRVYVETIFNQKQVDRAEELVAPDFLDHAALPGQAPGLQGAKQKWAMYLAGIPDLRVTIEELVAEADKVAVRRSYDGTHQGELLGVPPTGKQVRIGGISIFRLAGGKIAEHWEMLDRLTLMQQLGVVPTPGQATERHRRPGQRTQRRPENFALPLATRARLTTGTGRSSAGTRRPKWWVPRFRWRDSAPRTSADS